MIEEVLQGEKNEVKTHFGSKKWGSETKSFCFFSLLFYIDNRGKIAKINKKANSITNFNLRFLTFSFITFSFLFGIFFPKLTFFLNSIKEIIWTFKILGWKVLPNFKNINLIFWTLQGHIYLVYLYCGCR